LSTRFAVTYLDATFVDTGSPATAALEGNRLPGIAEQSAFLQTTLNLPWRVSTSHPLALSITADYRSDIAATDDNQVIAPARTVFSASLSTQWQTPDWRIEPWLRIDNLTDKVYVASVVVNQGNGRAFEPAPGRSWSTGIKLQRRF